MHHQIDKLLSSPFERLSCLLGKQDYSQDIKEIGLSFGEPQHPPYASALEALANNVLGVARYPAIGGLPELRQAIAAWAQQRFELKNLDSEHQVLPVNGTREAIFAFVQATLDRSRPARVAMPNPFYHIYEGATLLAGGRPLYLDCKEENGFLPDINTVSEDTWRDVQLVFVCSPGNPSGTITSIQDFHRLMELADEFDFVIASDECYSEIYIDENMPPSGLLQACARAGCNDYNRCIVFHSLSKRSNLPGLRSGFVAGDERLISSFKRYRTYHGCAMSLPLQHASIAAWRDEIHVRENRQLYREKISAVTEILAPVLDFPSPEASFYLWPTVPRGEDEAFARSLYAEERVRVLPGSYLGRPGWSGHNPGAGRVRISLVAEPCETIEAAHRIHRFIQGCE